METFVTVLTFTYPYEVPVIRARLESEGIACYVKDEFTIQVKHIFSQAIGGIKLQVMESDVSRALEILKEGGYISEKD